MFSTQYPDAKLYKRMPKREAARMSRPVRIYRDYGLETEALVWTSGKLVAPPSCEAYQGNVAPGKTCYACGLMASPEWNGMCPAGKHGLDHQSHPCDLCAALTTPVVHLNGSGRERLMTQYHSAYMKLHDTLVALRSLDIHDRDYYPLGPDAGPKARAENAVRVDKVASVMAEINEIYESLLPT